MTHRRPAGRSSLYLLPFSEKALNYSLVSRDVPPSKAMLGVPFYGRSLKNYHANLKAILAGDRRAAAKDISDGYAYNGFATIRAKTLDLARDRAGGIMIWQITQAQAEKTLCSMPSTTPLRSP